MDALGMQLFFIVVVAMFWPESLGRWLRKVKNGYGPSVTDIHLHTTGEPKP